MRNRLVLVSGTSASGKTTVVNKLLNLFPGQIGKVVTATTRAPRSGEIHGKDYLFYDREVFGRMIGGGHFIEHADIHGQLYGTPFSSLLYFLGTTPIILLPIDVHGHASIRRSQDPRISSVDLVSIFIDVPLTILEKRMRDRGDNENDIRRRLITAKSELSRRGEYDVIINNWDWRLNRTIGDVREFLGFR